MVIFGAPDVNAGNVCDKVTTEIVKRYIRDQRQLRSNGRGVTAYNQGCPSA